MNSEKPDQENRLSGTKVNNFLPYLAWGIVLVATVGSLFFSEVMQLPPCSLCWYQRIAIFPLVLIIGTGIILRDERFKFYAIPLCFAGLAVSVYHNLLYYGIIPETLTPCTEGASCTSTQLELFGFITIPLLALGVFVSVAVSLLIYKTK